MRTGALAATWHIDISLFLFQNGEMRHPAVELDRARLDELISLCSDYEKEIDYMTSTSTVPDEQGLNCDPSHLLPHQFGAISFYASTPNQLPCNSVATMQPTLGIPQNR